MRVNGLITTFRYRKKDIPVVDGVSFEVYEGKAPGIVGEYGCGKSTRQRVPSHHFLLHPIPPPCPMCIATLRRFPSPRE